MGSQEVVSKIKAREKEAKEPAEKQLAFILGLLISGFNCAIPYLFHSPNNWLPYYYCQLLCFFLYLSSLLFPFPLWL